MDSTTRREADGGYACAEADVGSTSADLVRQQLLDVCRRLKFDTGLKEQCRADELREALEHTERALHHLDVARVAAPPPPPATGDEAV